MVQSEKELQKTNNPIVDDEPSLGERLVLLGQKMGRAIVSASGMSVIFALISFVVLSFLLSYGYLAVEKTVVDGVSTMKFVAPYAFEVVDQEETDRLIYGAQLKVDASPVYQPREPFNQKVQNSLESLFTDLNEIRKSDRSVKLEQKRELFNQIAILAENPESSFIFDQLVKRKVSDNDWDKIKSSTEYTVYDRVMVRGMTREDYFERREEIIRQASPPSLSRTQRKLVRSLAWSVVLPNKIVDEKEMDRLRKEAAEKVEPVIRNYRKGEKIVDKGELVTPVTEAALEKIGRSVKGVNWGACIGVVLLTAFFVLTLWGYMQQYNRKEFFKPSYTALMMTLTIVAVILFILTQRLTALDDSLLLSPYLFPLAAYALIISIFTHPRVGMFATTFLVFLIALAVKADTHMLAVLLFGSLTGVYVLNRKLNFRDRGQLMWAGLYVSLTNMVLIVAVHLITSTSLFMDNWTQMVVDMSWGAVSGLLSTVLTIGILPLLESSFRLVTPYTLLELSNHDKPLLKRMQYEAPGTFHHSLMVASLSESAAEAIGANALLTRVGSLYHDIGKMKRPLFFIENLAYFGAENPHDKLTPRLSKMVITAHPRDSIEMAKQHHLPEALTDYMTEHHGTFPAVYFYNQACIQEGEENVNKSQFRYPGPKPRTRETAIVMMADACESAVRALKNPTVAQIEERIDKIVQARIDDGQFDNCPITFRDITEIKAAFLRVLRGIQHNRIEYQQTMMRELGKKLPEPNAPNLSALQQASGGGHLKVVGGQEEEQKTPPPTKEDSKDNS